MTTGHIGERIAAYRRRRGMSQAALAGLVGRSESWLSQVERGVRSVDRLSVLLDISRVLRVEVETLTGRPWQFAPNGGHVLDGLDGVRRLRHYFATMLIVAGTDPTDVQRALRHSSLRITLETYVHWWPRKQRRRNIIGSALRPVSQPEPSLSQDQS